MKPLYLSYLWTNVGQIEYMTLNINTNQSMKNLPLIFCLSAMSKFLAMLSQKFLHHPFGHSKYNGISMVPYTSNHSHPHHLSITYFLLYSNQAYKIDQNVVRFGYVVLLILQTI